MADECTEDHCALFMGPGPSCIPRDNEECTEGDAMMTTAEDNIQAIGQTGNNQPANLSNGIATRPLSGINDPITEYFKEWAETRVATLAKRLDHVNPQLEHLKDEMARIDNEGHMSQQACRDLVIAGLQPSNNPELMEAVQTSVQAIVEERGRRDEAAMKGLQSQMDKLTLRIKHLPGPKAVEERDSRKLVQRERSRQPAPAQSVTTALPRLSNNERIKAVEEDVGKTNKDLEAKDREIAELQEMVSQLQKTVFTLTHAVKTLQQQRRAE
ncbi:hypothetical protein B0I37DRAFT_416109 [Chaetomium sp. MPI-CAGE-AT-0009]|nr:hypothetical protein B0I37DRAFT_416109 [Chaetomium sp. MPI-CAGE-AT-0009]